jgi:hypothetical protein
MAVNSRAAGQKSPSGYGETARLAAPRLAAPLVAEETAEEKEPA